MKKVQAAVTFLVRNEKETTILAVPHSTFRLRTTLQMNTTEADLGDHPDRRKLPTASLARSYSGIQRRIAVN